MLDNAWLRTWTRLGLAAWLQVLAAALVLIGRLIERIRSGRAFTDTSRTLRRLALVIGLGVPVAIGLDTYGGGLIAGRAGLGPYYGHHLTWVSIGAWFGAVMITLALAEAFRHGERMRHDLDGLV